MVGPISSKRNTADGRIVTHPEGAFQNHRACVAMLDKGTTIACASRLAPAILEGSEWVVNYDAVH